VGTAQRLRPCPLRSSAAGWLRQETDATRAWFESAIALTQKGASTLADFVPAIALLFEFDVEKALADDEVAEVLRGEGIEQFVAQIVEELRAHGAPSDAASYQTFVERLKGASSRKGKTLFMPIRVAATGRAHGPELVALIPLLEGGARVSGLAPIVPPLARAEALLGALRARGAS